MKQQRYAEAIITYKKATGLKRVFPAKLQYNLALAYQKIDDYTSSIAHAKKALFHNPYHYNSYSVLGRAYFKTGKYGEAERTYKDAMRIFPD